MLTFDRRSKILEYIAENGSASVSELANRFGASESTIRRDLSDLADSGRLDKVHGGAKLKNQEFTNREDTINVKVQKHYKEKMMIAEYAASLINDRDYVFIDAGSTTLLMTTFIKSSNATFITNGIAQAHELVKNGCRVMVLGGELKDTTEAIVGVVAAQNLQKYNFSKSFIGANGITLKQGITTTDTSEAVIKAVAIEKSFASFVLVDSSKFGKVSAVSAAKLNSACIICDKCPDEEIKKKTIVKEVGTNDLHSDTESGS